jgi:hypothetical protein
VGAGEGGGSPVLSRYEVPRSPHCFLLEMKDAAATFSSPKGGGGVAKRGERGEGDRVAVFPLFRVTGAIF